jgi:uncharacterized GH25 family protein
VRTNFQRLAAAAFATALTAWTHYTWVSPVSDLQAGKTVQIRVSHGDVFPNTEEAVNASQVKLFVVSPSGVRTDLKAASAGTFVAAPFTAKENGVHRIGFTQERGAMSRTPKGVKPGGRDKNSDATEAFTLTRTGTWQSGKSFKPTGLDVELGAEPDPKAAAAWNVQLLRKGKPLAGQKVQVVLSGADSATDVGVTNADGKVTWKGAPSAKAPVMFLCEFSEKTAAGNPVDANRFSTTLFLTW